MCKLTFSKKRKKEKIFEVEVEKCRGFSTEINSLKLKGRIKEQILQAKKAYSEKNKNMFIRVRAEEIITIRRAIITCANGLTAAVHSENRYNARLIDETMSTLANVITDVHDHLEGKWFSARVRVPGGATGMFTTKKCRRVSN
jgi:hypothetical protein